VTTPPFAKVTRMLAPGDPTPSIVRIASRPVSRENNPCVNVNAPIGGYVRLHRLPAMRSKDRRQSIQAYDMSHTYTVAQGAPASAIAEMPDIMVLPVAFMAPCRVNQIRR
jgi:hypothetical protein